MIRMLLLMLSIGFYTNAFKLSFETGIPGMNIANVVFLLTVIAIMAGKPLPGMAHRERSILTAPILTYYAALVFGFFVAQFTMPGVLGDDLTFLKNYLFAPLFFFLYRRCNLDEKQTRILIIFVMLVAAIAAVQAVRQGNDYGFGHYSDLKRASGPFGADYRNANRAGVFYAMYMPMFVAMALFFRENRLWRMISISCVVLTAIAIMATYSRQAYLIAIIASALLLIRKSVMLAVLLGLLAIPAIAFLPDSVTQRVEETEQKSADGRSEGVDGSTASRFELWSGGAQMLKDHQLGVGLRRFPKYIGQYTSYAGYDAHNYFVLTAAELGLTGLAALLWLVWRAWKLARQIQKASAGMDAETRALGIGLPVMVIAMALGNLYGSPFYESGVMVNFWILLGLMDYYIALRRSEPQTGAETRVPQQENRIAARFPLAAGIAPGRYGGRRGAAADDGSDDSRPR